jgi:hypothetical protein
VCVCVCVREREREREPQIIHFILVQNSMYTSCTYLSQDVKILISERSFLLLLSMLMSIT